MAYCLNPNYSQRLGFTACGKCLNCLKNKRKEWADRLKIEMRYHKYNYFIGLTYSPDNYPADGSLSKVVAQKFKKRLEYYLGYTPRIFIVGEYGDETQRAHYHAAIFADTDCFDAIRKAWTLGNVDIEHLTFDRCNYISGYVVKKMTKADDIRLDGRHPEFYLACKNPALGYHFLYEILEQIVTDEKFRSHIMTHVYPPYSLKMNGKWLRLPRYIREKLQPLWKIYNEEKQSVYKAEKAARDRLVEAQISQIVLGLPELTKTTWSEIRYEQRDKLKLRESLIKQADKIKNRRYL